MLHTSRLKEEIIEMGLYYPTWIILIAVSLWASLGGFIWAHRNGQFKDQERARYLPLRGEQGPTPSKQDRGAAHEAYVFLGILAFGMSGLLAVGTMIILTMTGGRP